MSDALIKYEGTRVVITCYIWWHLELRGFGKICFLQIVYATASNLFSVCQTPYRALVAALPAACTLTITNSSQENNPLAFVPQFMTQPGRSMQSSIRLTYSCVLFYVLLGGGGGIADHSSEKLRKSDRDLNRTIQQASYNIQDTFKTARKPPTGRGEAARTVSIQTQGGTQGESHAHRWAAGWHVRITGYTRCRWPPLDAVLGRLDVKSEVVWDTSALRGEWTILTFYIAVSHIWCMLKVTCFGEASEGKKKKASGPCW